MVERLKWSWHESEFADTADILGGDDHQSWRAINAIKNSDIDGD